MNLVWQFEPVKVEFHLDNSYTKVVYVRLVGLGMLDDWFTDIPPSSILPKLRFIGKVFLLLWQSTYNPGNLVDILAAYSELPIVTLE